ncbi:MAG: ABC transporter ATP-binding protein [Acidimicrobiales bacterium]|nr:ABC transporter ATP-binding protein [Acidimicrobiales bacterium]
MLEVDSLSVRYGAVAALSDVSFVARDGAITTVLGANGAGKTTLLRALSGLVRPAKGVARYDDQVLTGRQVEDVARMGVAHVPEGRGVIAELTVEENLRLGALAHHRGRSRTEVTRRTYELFPALEARRRQPASSLSGGERQLLAIGRALCARPRLLLLDEPSLGLAPAITTHVLSLLDDLAGEGLCVVLVEQNARSALSVSQWAVVLNLGRVVMSDRAESVASDEDLRHHYLGF